MTVIKGLLGSKKFIASMLAVAAQVALQFGWELDADQALAIVSPLMAYILGQAAVDVRKTAPAVEAKS